MNIEKDFEKRFVEENHQGLLYMIDPDIENPEETAKAHLEIIAKHWLRPNLAKEKQKLGEEIMKLATEPMWDKNQDIRYQDIKTRTPRELCKAIDNLLED